MPLVVDEIGITGDREALGRMLTIADGDLPVNAAPFLRVKAIEALGRLEAEEADHHAEANRGDSKDIWLAVCRKSCA